MGAKCIFNVELMSQNLTENRHNVACNKFRELTHGTVSILPIIMCQGPKLISFLTILEGARISQKITDGDFRKFPNIFRKLSVKAGQKFPKIFFGFFYTFIKIFHKFWTIFQKISDIWVITKI